MYKVYTITNLKNNTKYVGFTSKDLSVRFEWHMTRSNCRRLHNAIKKYGAENFSIRLLNEFEKREDALSFEAEMILKLNTLNPNGYNLTYGGISPKMTDETRLKMSLSQKNRTNRPAMPEEQKRKISQTRILRKIKPSAESILKGLKTKKVNDKKLPEDFGKKISERQLGGSNPAAVSVMCVQDSMCFDSAIEAARYYNVNYCGLLHVLNGRNKTVGKNKLNFIKIK